MQMVALELKLQTEAKERERRALEEEELTVHRLKLEMLHQVQLKKETDLDKKRREVTQEWQELVRDRKELDRKEKELDEGLKGFTCSLGAPKTE